jgi:hypothetical protein
MTLKQSFTYWSFAKLGTDLETLLRRAAEINYPTVFQAVAENGWNCLIGHKFISTEGSEDGLRRVYNFVLQAQRWAQGFLSKGFSDLVAEPL